MRSNDDRELDIRLAELQIRHQHLASAFTVLISVTMSVSISIFIGYLTIGITLKESVWTSDAFVILIFGSALTYVIYRRYLQLVDRLEKEIQELEKQYVW